VEIYFFRHGPAGSADAWEGSDADRPLTDQGRELTARVVDRLAATGLNVDLIVTSPYARAVQTAELATKVLVPGGRVEQDDGLRPGFGFSTLQRILRSHADLNRLMLVGHEGDFTKVIGEMIGGSPGMVLKKSGIALVDVTDSGATDGELRWLVPPSLLS
jgi:phosphohistidine phosphatase